MTLCKSLIPAPAPWIFSLHAHITDHSHYHQDPMPLAILNIRLGPHCWLLQGCPGRCQEPWLPCGWHLPQSSITTTSPHFQITREGLPKRGTSCFMCLCDGHHNDAAENTCLELEFQQALATCSQGICKHTTCKGRPPLLLVWCLLCPGT